MRFFFPDSQDQIDPLFDLQSEEHPIFRVRQRHDRYAHELIAPAPYDGILVSKVMVDGTPEGLAGKYTVAQRHRLYRVGVREFFRLKGTDGQRLAAMGDCGAFAYVRHEEPPFSVESVIDFYEGCGFEYGIAVDHVILGYQAEGGPRSAQLGDWQHRQNVTLGLAADFLRRHRERRCKFSPLGVAQGWSPQSYARAVKALQRIGYSFIALGGLAALKTSEILQVLAGVGAVRDSRTSFHLLGVTRCEHVRVFSTYGVKSFDSTSPFRQAFKDAKDNFYWRNRNFTALRVPQVDGNLRLKRRILAGEVDQAEAFKLEKACLEYLRAFDSGDRSVDEVVDVLSRYEDVHSPGAGYATGYREILEAAPWRDCDCWVCRSSGVEAAIFRGAERNKRRGFHNLHVFRRRLDQEGLIGCAMASGRDGE